MKLVGLATTCVLAITLGIVDGVGAARAGMGADGRGECRVLQESGVSKGLYGLCVAFCEAHACVPDFAAEDPFAGCRPGDEKLLRKYEARMRPGDPAMPCLPVAAECPCWSQADLDALPDIGPLTFDAGLRCDSLATQLLLFGLTPTGNESFGLAAVVPDESSCQYGRVDDAGEVFTTVDGLSAGEAVACAADVVAAGEARGLTCP